GKTAAGNLVYVDPRSVKTKDGITSARIQVKFVTPVQTPQGVWKLSRHDAMFDCAKKTVAAKASTYYSDAAATKVVKRDVIAKPGFGPAIGGSMTQVALDYICKSK
ncbi:MAG TPA: surface-adhesin E family protein, partial [Polyangiales bacterium]|nr:surface-adhesin E family protein [Polyangiales bacterium]